MLKCMIRVCTRSQRMPCGILKSRRSSRRASAIASARQIRICIWDGLGFDEHVDDDDDEGGLDIGGEASEPSSDLSLFAMSVEGSCSSSSTCCPESGEDLSGSISEEAIL